MSRWPRPLATQLVGSYSKPAWLLRKGIPGEEAWRAEPDVLADAQDDCVRLAVHDQEHAGLDLLTDGEGRRLNYARHFFNGWQGVDPTQMVDWPDGRGGSALRPRVVGPLAWPGPQTVADLRFLKRLTDRPVKATAIGPVTSATRLADDYYREPEALLLACAAVINAELRALQDEGCALLQVDDPGIHLGPGPFLPYAARALARALEGITTPVAGHLCYGYAHRHPTKQVDPRYAAALELVASCPGVGWISLEYTQPGHTPEVLRACGEKGVILGVLDLGTETAERPETIASRVGAALEYVPPARLHLAPDCGMWHLPRPVAQAKLRALALAAELVRSEVGE
jgi:5-methyltetrahydropteroyltriglutamate--homocysteine methyltransferase